MPVADGIYRTVYYDNNKNLDTKNEYNNCRLVVSNGTWTFYDNKNNMISSCTTSYDNGHITGSWSNGSELDGEIKSADYGYKYTDSDGSSIVQIPYFNGVYRCTAKTLYGKNVFDECYAIIEGNSISKFKYSDADISISKNSAFQAGTFVYDNGIFTYTGSSNTSSGQPETLTFTDTGFTTSDSLGNTYYYTRFFTGTWEDVTPLNEADKYTVYSNSGFTETYSGKQYSGFFYMKDGLINYIDVTDDSTITEIAFCASDKGKCQLYTKDGKAYIWNKTK